MVAGIFSIMANSSSCKDQRPFRLKPALQRYAWGQTGDTAFIPNFLGLESEPDTAYAELWYGTHPNGPSMVVDPNEGSLNFAEWLAAEPEKRLGIADLPYLLKVLSAREALSIQVHPGKTQAESLHARDPEHYPDANHKPEIAIAIDHLDALVGFVDDGEFKASLQTYPPLGRLLPEAGTLAVGVQQYFDLLSNAPERIRSCNEMLYQQLGNQSSPTFKENLYCQMHVQYGPSDPGLLLIFWMNLVQLGPGEAIFLAAGIPHAYLQGNIIECMANSDNVIRLGLTPKFCDLPALISVIELSQTDNWSVTTAVDAGVTAYLTQAAEFGVKCVTLNPDTEFFLSPKGKLMTLLVLDGEIAVTWNPDHETCMCRFHRGHSFILPASLEEVCIKTLQGATLYWVEIPD